MENVIDPGVQISNGLTEEEISLKSSTMSLQFDSKNIDDISSPSDLKFDEEDPINDDNEICEKKKLIEKCLLDGDVTLEQLQYFAKSKGGLVNDEFRRKIWPLLVGVTESEKTQPPSLDELSQHKEYNQVVLDVNRSLKRFPPGIPYEQRVALQDQLTVLILRVIIKYPHLKYYQGYHDVAITFLLVCGDRASFPLLCRLSYGDGAPLAPFMQTTMQPTQHRLNYLLPIIYTENPTLGQFLERSTVGTMFALPWYLTWFGHSLNKYTDVVRLYDYFLCSPPLFPVYVTAAIVIHRSQEVLECECEMAMLHCLLSRLPDDLPFEEILKHASKLYEHNDPKDLEKEVEKLERKEEEQRKADEQRLRERQLLRRNGGPVRPTSWSARMQAQLRKTVANSTILRMMPFGYRTIFATATVLIGVYAYYRPDFMPFSINR